MQVRQLRLRVDIAHESDVEDVAQVAEGLARADLAARVGWEHEGLRKEEHLKAGRSISHLDGASNLPSSCDGKTTHASPRLWPRSVTSWSKTCASAILLRRLENEPDILFAEPPAHVLGPDGHRQHAHGKAQGRLGSICIGIVGEDRPDEAGGRINPEAPTPMPDHAGDIVGSQLHAIETEHHPCP